MAAVTRDATTTNVSVGNVSTAVLATKPERKIAVFVNDSDEEIYLAFGSTAVLNEGIRLNAAGGAYEINYTNRYTGPVSAICATGGKNLTITESPV